MGAQDIVGALKNGLVQSDRLIKLDTPLGNNVLLPQRVVGHSRIGRDYSFTVDAVSTSGNIELKTLIAQAVTLWIQQSDQAYFPHHGYISSARRLGSDGALSHYQISFTSWLHLLRFRKDAAIWQDKSADLILTDVFNRHPQAQGAFRFALSKPAPARSFCVQYENDWNFAMRLMENEGWFSYVEQAADGKSHTVVITDNLDALPALKPQKVEFYRGGTRGESNALLQWSGARSLQSSTLTTRTFDYKAPSGSGNPKGTTIPTLGTQGNLPSQTEVYEYSGAYTFNEQERGKQLSKIRMEEWESRAKRFHGSGGVRCLDAGRWFELSEHPEHSRDTQQNRQFAIIAANWFIENNLPVANDAIQFPYSLQALLAQAKAQQSSTAGDLTVPHPEGSDGFFLVQVEAQRKAIPFRSPLEHAKPVMSLQTATVVGPANQEVYTDTLNRIKVQMHWDRLNPGDEQASCWLRVAYPDAGNGYGGVHVPRIGEEVVVSFMDSDCDRPVVTARVYNSAKQPHWHSNGLLSGYKSKEHQGGGYNQLVMDDATGQNRTQLYSSSNNSALHLGYLIEQTGNTRGSYLGSGFDLKSEAYGALRAGQGLYVSTHPPTSQPLDARAASSQLVGSESILEAMSDASTAHQAESLQHGYDALKSFTDATQNSVAGPVSGGVTAGGGTGNANTFKEPIMLFASPAGIALSSQQSSQLHADQQINLVSGQSTHIATGKSLIVSVAEKISLFVQNAGMKLFAAKGKVEIQAHSDAIELTAQKTLRLLSATEKIEAAADQAVELHCAGAYIRIAGGNIDIHAPGVVDIKGTQHTLNGPTRGNYPLPALPSSKYNAAMQYLYHDDEPIRGAKYTATLSDDSVREGVLDSSGRMQLQDVPSGTIQVALGPDTRLYNRKDTTQNPDYKGGQLSDGDIDSIIGKHGGA